MYKVGESVVLTTSRPAQKPGESGKRGERVAIVLSELARQAWRVAGEQWRMWSRRLISACLQTGRTKDDQLYVLSCRSQTFSMFTAA